MEAKTLQSKLSKAHERFRKLLPEKQLFICHYAIRKHGVTMADLAERCNISESKAYRLQKDKDVRAFELIAWRTAHNG